MSRHNEVTRVQPLEESATDAPTTAEDPLAFLASRQRVPRQHD
jgi:hypothetical protein